jgi:hypothetical protein
MAKFDLKFIDLENDDDYIQVNIMQYDYDVNLKKKIHVIDIHGECAGNEFLITMDKSTAIKFAKTLRTEINKMEVDNG